MFGRLRHLLGWVFSVFRSREELLLENLALRLFKLGFDISERTVSRWVKRANHDPDPARRWLAFLRNHREAIAAMDFFTVPSLTFGVLYCHLGPTARETE